MDEIKFVEDSLQKIRRDMVYLSRPHHFKLFKGRLPQILLGPYFVPYNTVYKLQLLPFGLPVSNKPKLHKLHVVSCPWVRNVIP